MNGASVLPYRTDAESLSSWLEARARGRTAEQLRGAAASPKAVEGTAAAAEALGFTDSAEGSLTSTGERFALAAPEERRSLLRDAILAYAPYREMLRALAERGMPPETEVRWIEAWWATRGHGSSESNRREGAAAFGRLADFSGLGEYIPGRRGRPTRIRWVPGAIAPHGVRPVSARTATGELPPRAAAEFAPDLFTSPPAAPPAPDLAVATARPSPPLSPPPTEGARPVRPRGEATLNRITVPLAGDAVARIEVPLRMPAEEKRRLLNLLQLLIGEE